MALVTPQCRPYNGITRHFFRQCKSRMAEGKKEENDYTRWEKDFDLYPLEQLDLFYEYLEIGMRERLGVTINLEEST